MPELNCPICQKKLEPTNLRTWIAFRPFTNWHGGDIATIEEGLACPDGHGFAIKGFDGYDGNDGLWTFATLR